VLSAQLVENYSDDVMSAVVGNVRVVVLVMRVVAGMMEILLWHPVGHHRQVHGYLPLLQKYFLTLVVCLRQKHHFTFVF